MPRPRFLKLDQAKQRAILDAARAEFSEHGYQGASQNRIIERAGVSKGAMYYYFDDKDDLYATVVRRELQGLGEILKLGPVDSPEAFWEGLEAMFLESTVFMARTPETMALARSVARTFGAYGAPPGVRALIDEAYATTGDIVETGQRVGAVRDDLPKDLLVGIAMKVGEAMDFWFAEHWPEISLETLPALNRKLLNVFQRIAAPEPTAS